MPCERRCKHGPKADAGEPGQVWARPFPGSDLQRGRSKWGQQVKKGERPPRSGKRLKMQNRLLYASDGRQKVTKKLCERWR